MQHLRDHSPTHHAMVNNFGQPGISPVAMVTQGMHMQQQQLITQLNRPTAQQGKKEPSRIINLRRRLRKIEETKTQIQNGHRPPFNKLAALNHEQLIVEELVDWETNGVLREGAEIGEDGPPVRHYAQMPGPPVAVMPPHGMTPHSALSALSHSIPHPVVQPIHMAQSMLAVQPGGTIASHPEQDDGSWPSPPVSGGPIIDAGPGRIPSRIINLRRRMEQIHRTKLALQKGEHVHRKKLQAMQAEAEIAAELKDWDQHGILWRDIGLVATSKVDEDGHEEQDDHPPINIHVHEATYIHSPTVSDSSPRSRTDRTDRTDRQSSMEPHDASSGRLDESFSGFVNQGPFGIHRTRSLENTVLRGISPLPPPAVVAAPPTVAAPSRPITNGLSAQEGARQLDGIIRPVSSPPSTNRGVADILAAAYHWSSLSTAVSAPARTQEQPPIPSIICTTEDPMRSTLSPQRPNSGAFRRFSDASGVPYPSVSELGVTVASGLLSGPDSPDPDQPPPRNAFLDATNCGEMSLLTTRVLYQVLQWAERAKVTRWIRSVPTPTASCKRRRVAICPQELLTAGDSFVPSVHCDGVELAEASNLQAQPDDPQTPSGGPPDLHFTLFDTVRVNDACGVGVRCNSAAKAFVSVEYDPAPAFSAILWARSVTPRWNQAGALAADRGPLGFRLQPWVHSMSVDAYIATTATDATGTDKMAVSWIRLPRKNAEVAPVSLSSSNSSLSRSSSDEGLDWLGASRAQMYSLTCNGRDNAKFYLGTDIVAELDMPFSRPTASNKAGTAFSDSVWIGRDLLVNSFCDVVLYVFLYFTRALTPSEMRTIHSAYAPRFDADAKQPMYISLCRSSGTPSRVFDASRAKSYFNVCGDFDDDAPNLTFQQADDGDTKGEQQAIAHNTEATPEYSGGVRCHSARKGFVSVPYRMMTPRPAESTASTKSSAAALLSYTAIVWARSPEATWPVSGALVASRSPNGFVVHIWGKTNSVDFFLINAKRQGGANTGLMALVPIRLSSVQTAGVGKLDVSQPNMYAMTIDGAAGVAVAFINGQPHAKHSGTPDPLSLDVALQCATGNGASGTVSLARDGNRFCDAIYYQFMLFPSCLSASQISEIHVAYSKRFEAPLIPRFHLDLADISGGLPDSSVDNSQALSSSGTSSSAPSPYLKYVETRKEVSSAAVPSTAASTSATRVGSELRGASPWEGQRGGRVVTSAVTASLLASSIAIGGTTATFVHEFGGGACSLVQPIRYKPHKEMTVLVFARSTRTAWRSAESAAESSRAFVNLVEDNKFGLFAIRGLVGTSNVEFAIGTSSSGVSALPLRDITTTGTSSPVLNIRKVHMYALATDGANSASGYVDRSLVAHVEGHKAQEAIRRVFSAVHSATGAEVSSTMQLGPLKAVSAASETAGLAASYGDAPTEVSYVALVFSKCLSAPELEAIYTRYEPRFSAYDTSELLFDASNTLSYGMVDPDADDPMAVATEELLQLHGNGAENASALLPLPRPLSSGLVLVDYGVNGVVCDGVFGGAVVVPYQPSAAMTVCCWLRCIHNEWPHNAAILWDSAPYGFSINGWGETAAIDFFVNDDSAEAVKLEYTIPPDQLPALDISRPMMLTVTTDGMDATAYINGSPVAFLPKLPSGQRNCLNRSGIGGKPGDVPNGMSMLVIGRDKTLGDMGNYRATASNIKHSDIVTYLVVHYQGQMLSPTEVVNTYRTFGSRFDISGTGNGRAGVTPADMRTAARYVSSPGRPMMCAAIGGVDPAGTIRRRGGSLIQRNHYSAGQHSPTGPGDMAYSSPLRPRTEQQQAELANATASTRKWRSKSLTNLSLPNLAASPPKPKGGLAVQTKTTTGRIDDTLRTSEIPVSSAGQQLSELVSVTQQQKRRTRSILRSAQQQQLEQSADRIDERQANSRRTSLENNPDEKRDRPLSPNSLVDDAEVLSEGRHAYSDTDSLATNETPHRMSHWLERTWTIWFDTTTRKGMTQEEYDEILLELGDFNTLEGFWLYWDNLHVDNLKDNCNLRFFQKGHHPSWEDQASKSAMRWVARGIEKKRRCDIWEEVVVAVVSEQLDPMAGSCCVSGLVLSSREKGDAIQIWVQCDSVDPVGISKVLASRLPGLSFSRVPINAPARPPSSCAPAPPPSSGSRVTSRRGSGSGPGSRPVTPGSRPVTPGTGSRPVSPDQVGSYMSGSRSVTPTNMVVHVGGQLPAAGGKEPSSRRSTLTKTSTAPVGSGNKTTNSNPPAGTTERQNWRN